jgi:dTDP-4-dehydrorhamnose 3,5-epimerase
MNVVKTRIPDVLLFEPKVFGDDRGFFFESYNKKVLADLGLERDFVQDNHSRSSRGVLRGLHYQLLHTQGKLIRVIAGAIWDVAVDIRRGSPTFGLWVGEELSAENKRLFWIPEGFAHGFVVLSDIAEVLYKASDFYAPGHEQSLLWNDPGLNIKWPLDGEPIISAKDKAGVLLRDAPLFD